jgi:hypothetical protein
MMASSSQRFGIAALFTGLAIGWGMALPAQAQQVRSQAVAGTPFGVGRVEVEVPRGLLPEGLGVTGLGLFERDGRALYPVVENRPIRGLLRELLDRPQRVTIYFLFDGDAPLHLTVQSRVAQTLVVTPIKNPGLHQAAMGVWWATYTAPPRLLQPTPDSPPLVENYLQAMLARRLGLPLKDKPLEKSWQTQLASEAGLALGTETVRLKMARDRMLQRTELAQRADQPLPEPVAVPDLEIPEEPKDVPIEPIATHVPAECLYVRFGSFSNFLWIQDTLELWGGDLQNLVALRGLDYGIRQRMEAQLALRQSALSRLLGETSIADVALIGTDLFFKEGAAWGLLFQSRGNNAFLAADFKRQWAERMQQDKSVKETKVTIDGRDVALLSSPDGRTRSYYATEGDYHLFTSSKTIARRFLAIQAGQGSLGATNEFRRARSLMPVNRNDTIFVYVSDGFFRNLVSPAYRIEMVRRLQAQADMELVQLANLVSATEGRQGGTIENVKGNGYLPADFGVRPDGSQTVLEQGEAYDSLRGHRGAFVPIPDVDVQQVSPSEAEDYREFAAFYQSRWQRLDPILVGIRRHAVAGNRDRIVIDARMTPVARRQYEQLTEWAGPADKQRFAPVAGDSVAFEMIQPRQRLFGGLQNFDAPLDTTGQFLPWDLLYKITEGYLGYIGEPGWLSFLDRGLSAPPEAMGYAVGPAGLWRYRDPQKTVYSLQRPVLDRVVPQLQFEEAERLAQFRLRVSDVSNGPMTPLLNDLGYGRTLRTSVGNLYLLHTLVQQLHVPGEHAQKAAEMLLDAALICPLGGQYVYNKTPEGLGYWTSTGLAASQPLGPLRAKAPEGYLTPPLNWFRGLNLDALLTPEALSVHAEILMQRPAKKNGNGQKK